MSKIVGGRFYKRNNNIFIKIGGVVYCVCQVCKKRTKRKYWGGTKYCSFKCKWNDMFRGKTNRELTDDKFYNAWAGLKKRCNCKTNKMYKDYGLRGIRVCKRWDSFSNFADDMYQSYLKHTKEHGAKQTTIDRIDNSGNYCKENCRWATWKQQNNNRRKRRKKTNS